MEEELISIGQITKPQGTKGEVRVLPLTHNPRRFELLKKVWVIHRDHPPTAHNVQRVRYHKNFVLLKLAGCDTITQAKQQVGARLGISKDKLLPLPNNTYYLFEIIGLEVYTAGQQYLGKVEDIFSTGSNDVYVVRNDSRELLIPAIEQAIEKIDLAQGRMVLKDLKGLLE
jgi:16S rRNA processing protein RimM